MVIVEEDREQPHVLARGLEERVLFRTDGERLVEIRGAGAVDPDELDCLDSLRHAVFGQLEILEREVGDGFVARRHRDVYADQIGARPEDRCLG